MSGKRSRTTVLLQSCLRLCRFVIPPLVILYVTCFPWKGSPFFPQTYEPTSTERAEANLDRVLFVVRTTVYESSSTIPILRRTYLQNISNVVFYSDSEETVDGQNVADVIKDAFDLVKQTPSDVQKYEDLQAYGNAKGSFPESYLPGIQRHMDLFKFWPMVDRASKLMDADWYVFFDASTYLSLPALQKLLSANDPEAAQMIGKTGDNDYSGAATIFSSAAMRLLLNLSRSDGFDHSFERCRAYGCATYEGVLEYARKHARLKFDWKWPLFHNRQPANVGFTRNASDTQLWCAPVMGFPDVSAETMEGLWSFEQEWYRNHTFEPRFRDLFRHYVLPSLSVPEDKNRSVCRGCCEDCQNSEQCLHFGRYTDYSENGYIVSCTLLHVLDTGCNKGPGVYDACLEGLWDRIATLDADMPPCDPDVEWYTTRPVEHDFSSGTPGYWRFTDWALKVCMDYSSPGDCHASIEAEMRHLAASKSASLVWWTSWFRKEPSY